MKRIAVVAAVMLSITAAAVAGLLTWDDGTLGSSKGVGPPMEEDDGPMGLGEGGGGVGGPEGNPSFMVVGDWGCSMNCPQFATADTDQLSVSQQMGAAAKVRYRSAVPPPGQAFFSLPPTTIAPHRQPTCPSFGHVSRLRRVLLPVRR